MRFPKMLIVLAAVALSSQCFAAEVHPEITRSLNYSMPEHNCVKPRVRNSNTTGQLQRFVRKMSRFASCVKKYQSDLIADHQRIVASAEHGLATMQAEKLARILKVIENNLVTLGEDVVIEPDYSDLDRTQTLGNRSSI